MAVVGKRKLLFEWAETAVLDRMLDDRESPHKCAAGVPSGVRSGWVSSKE